LLPSIFFAGKKSHGVVNRVIVEKDRKEYCIKKKKDETVTMIQDGGASSSPKRGETTVQLRPKRKR